MNSQNRLRVSTDIDQKFKRSDYELIYARALDVLEVLQDRYKEIKNWSD